MCSHFSQLWNPKSILSRNRRPSKASFATARACPKSPIRLIIHLLLVDFPFRHLGGAGNTEVVLAVNAVLGVSLGDGAAAPTRRNHQVSELSAFATFGKRLTWRHSQSRQRRSSSRGSSSCRPCKQPVLPLAFFECQIRWTLNVRRRRSCRGWW